MNTLQQIMITIGMLAGGLGLFLLAINMISDGLKLAAGNTLRDILGKWTSTPIRGIISGISITAIVQSSSAVTVATIGFVNAGILNLYNALGIVYGANIGTTTTGWLVALIGFKINIEIIALPLVGIGMFLRLTGGESRRGPLGAALTGFGIFFVGIDVLKEAFEGLAASINLLQFTAEGISGVFLFLSIGFLMTVFTQSSSAAIAITLTATTGGIIGPYAAAAMVIGANVGTTSTAVLSVIGATPNAKRIAAAHVVFNVLTACVALLLLPLMFGIINAIIRSVGLEGVPVVTLALFHTIFNLLGVALMWPLSNRLTQFLDQRFTSVEEIEGRPRYLDKNIVVAPALALNALGMELSRIGNIARRMTKALLSQEGGTGRPLKSERRTIGQLVFAVGDFVSRLERSGIPKDISAELPKVLRTGQYFVMTSELVKDVAEHQSAVGNITNENLSSKLSQFKLEVIQLLDATNVLDEAFSVSECNDRLINLNESYDELKAMILETGAASGMDIPSMSALLEQNSNTRRLVTQMVKAARYLSELFQIANIINKPDYATTQQAE